MAEVNITWDGWKAHCIRLGCKWTWGRDVSTFNEEKNFFSSTSSKLTYSKDWNVKILGIWERMEQWRGRIAHFWITSSPWVWLGDCSQRRTSICSYCFVWGLSLLPLPTHNGNYSVYFKYLLPLFLLNSLFYVYMVIEWRAGSFP